MSRRVHILLAAILVLLLTEIEDTAPDGAFLRDSAGAAAPLVASVHVPDDALVFVHGHRIRGEAQFSWIPGDSLRINGYAIKPMPARVRSRRVYTDEELATVYGANPIVRELADSLGWGEAVEKFDQLLKAYIREAITKYNGAPGTDSVSGQGSVRVEEMSRQYVGTLLNEQPTTERGYLKFRVAGALIPIGVDLSRAARPAAERTRRTRSEDTGAGARWFVRNIQEAMTRGGYVILSPNGMAWGTDATMKAKIRWQIEGATPERVPDGPLGTAAIEEIVAVGGIDR